MRSSASRGRECGLRPRSRARSDNSFRRAFWLSASKYSSRIFFGSCVSAASIEWMPNSSSPVLISMHPALRSCSGSEARIRWRWTVHASIPQCERSLASTGAFARRSLAFLPGSRGAGFNRVRPALHQAKIDLAIFQARAQHLYAHGVAEAEFEATPFAAQQMPDRIEMVVVVRQLRDVNQS